MKLERTRTQQFQYIALLLLLQAYGVDYLDTPAHQALNLQVARESLVLLSNPSGALPLKLPVGAKIAVIGPGANNSAVLLGNYQVS